MPSTASGAARISYDVGGAGPSVLLLHAGVTDRRSWGPLVNALSGSARTISYDRRGFGATTYVPEPHSQLDDACAVLDATGADRVVLVGASNGGKHALDLALHRPERVAGLVLIGTAVRGAPGTPKAGMPKAVRDLIEAYEAADAGDDPDELNRVEAHFWLDGPVAPQGRVQGAARDLFLDMNSVALRAADPGEEENLGSAWDRLGQIGVPALVLCGDLDVFSLPISEHVAASIPEACSEVLVGTAHLPHLEGHRRCLDVVTTFVSEVKGT
jgi:pimeloyl-ACP methyl ester carboxylesterase